jgi:hypothetical protein
MDKRLGFFIILSAVLATFGILIYTTLEIYPRKRPVFPSMEAISNDYLAMDRWLSQTGHPVRIEKKSSPLRIVSAAGNVAIVQASACDWKASKPVLLPWIEQGGFLLVTLDSSFYDDELADFLSFFGIAYAEDEYTGDDTAEDGGAVYTEPPAEETPLPDLDFDIEIFVEERDNGVGGLAVLKDTDGTIRLARAALGDGGIAVTGTPYFMFTDYLDREINACLAWDLSAARTTADNAGVLFIREKHLKKGLFGNIADRGNAVPPGVSVPLLVLIGFWMVIPVFGLVFYDRHSAARPVRERLTAEIRFLKKYDALDYYLKVYLREIQLKSGGIDTGSCLVEIEQILQSGHRLKYRDLIKSLNTLESTNPAVERTGYGCFGKVYDPGSIPFVTPQRGGYVPFAYNPKWGAFNGT